MRFNEIGIESIINYLDSKNNLRTKIHYIEKIPLGTHDEGGWTTEDDGTLRDVNFVWFTDKEKNEINNG